MAELAAGSPAGDHNLSPGSLTAGDAEPGHSPAGVADPSLTAGAGSGATHRHGDLSPSQMSGLETGASLSPPELVEIVEILEVAAFLDAQRAEHLAGLAERAATASGHVGLARRVGILRADIDRRLGAYEPAVDAVRDGLAWAEEHDDDVLRARAHRVWSSLLRTAGDLTQALEHAVLAVRCLPDGASPPIRPYHVVGLATILDELGSTAEAVRLYDEVLAAATAEEQWPLALLVLNNKAYSEYERGEIEAASGTVAQMRAIVADHGAALDGMELDTIARVELESGHADRAVETLLPILEHRSSVPLNERASWADCMLTRAEAERRLGRLEAAQEALDRARRFCEDLSLVGQLVRVHESQAELYAAAGRWREAYEEHRRFSAQDTALRSLHRDQRAHLMEVMLRVDQARRDTAHFQRLATEDVLTGAKNRRWIEDELDRRAARASTGEPVSVALIDVDHFKAVNDTCSHAVGDKVLIGVSDLLRNGAPAGASVGRLGGDEFIVIMPGTDSRAALRAATLIRDAVLAHDWTTTGSDRPITVTIGVTAGEGRSGRSALLEQADANLYRGKRNGRDQVVGDPAADS